MTIPNSAAITAATITLYATSTWGEARAPFTCRAADNASTFTTHEIDVSGRTKTTHTATCSFDLRQLGRGPARRIFLPRCSEVVDRQPLAELGAGSLATPMVVLTVDASALTGGRCLPRGTSTTVARRTSRGTLIDLVHDVRANSRLHDRAGGVAPRDAARANLRQDCWRTHNSLASLRSQVDLGKLTRAAQGCDSKLTREPHEAFERRSIPAGPDRCRSGPCSSCVLRLAPRIRARRGRGRGLCPSAIRA